MLPRLMNLKMKLMNSNLENHEAEQEEQDESLYEHHKFVAEVGQSPLRVDKYLMNFIEIKFRKLQKAVIFM